MRRLPSRELGVATRKTSRQINRQIVLNMVRSRSPISRAELARLLGMQRSAVGRIVSELMRQELVREGAVPRVFQTSASLFR